MVLRILRVMLKSIGVRVSPMQRRSDDMRLIAIRNGIEQPTIRKYAEALGRMASSAPSRPGSGNESAAAALPMNTPNRRLNSMDSRTTLRARSVSRAPMCWAT